MVSRRLVASALDALGAPYEAARDTVLFDVARLVHGLPGILSLTFRDGTPFASPLTVDWIETEVQPTLGGDEEASSTTADDQMPVTEQFDKARQRLGGGNLDEALALMREGASEDRSEKETFHRRLYVAQLCMNGGRPAVARPLLDELNATIEQHALDTWSPPLALEVWTARCRCYDTLAQNASPEEKRPLFAEADAAFDNVCRVDATKAVELGKKRPSESLQ